jgi:hypothetical protein
LNRFSYAGNNPINRTDPSGHCTQASYSSNVVTDDECEAQPDDNDDFMASGGSNDNDDPCTSGADDCNSTNGGDRSENSILDILRYIAALNNWKISSPYPFILYSSENYAMWGGLRITYTPSLIFSNGSPVTMGTNDSTFTKSMLGGLLSIRGSINSELRSGFGVFTTQEINDTFQTAGVSFPASVNPYEISVNFHWQVGSSLSPVTFGNTITVQGRYNPPGMLTSLAVAAVVMAPELAVPAMIKGFCAATSGC